MDTKIDDNCQLLSEKTRFGCENRTPPCGCRSAAATRGQAAAILKKFHKLKKTWKNFNLNNLFLLK
jgi:hypothetical protein